MAFTNRPKHTASFQNRARSGFVTVGDLSEDAFVALLGSAPSDDTVIPGSGKTFGQLNMEDRINGTTSTNRTKHTGVFINRTKH